MNLFQLSYTSVLVLAVFAGTEAMEAPGASSYGAVEAAQQRKIFEEGSQRCKDQGGQCVLFDSCTEEKNQIPGDALCPRLDVVCCNKIMPKTTQYCLGGASRTCAADCGSSPMDYRSVCAPGNFCCVK